MDNRKFFFEMNDFNKLKDNYNKIYACLSLIKNNSNKFRNNNHPTIFIFLLGYFSKYNINFNDLNDIIAEYQKENYIGNDFLFDFKKISYIFCNYYENKNLNNSNNIINNNRNFINQSNSIAGNNSMNNNNFINNSNSMNANNSMNNNNFINNSNSIVGNNSMNNNNFINNSNSIKNNNHINNNNNFINNSNFINNNNSIYDNNLGQSNLNNIFFQTQYGGNENDINKDFLLAKQIEEQEKILYQIRSNKDAQNQTKKCEICLEDFSLLDETNYFLDCNCVLHNKCFDDLVKAAVENNTLPVKCPNCGTNVHPNYIEDSLRNINPQLYDKYEKFSRNIFLQKNSNEYSSCPTPGCEYMFFFNPGEFNFLCPLCGKHYCLNCKDEWHVNMTCQQYKDSRDVNKLDQQFYNFVRGAKFKMCPKCKYWVEKNQGCNHMKCRCGTDFCYLCGNLMDMSRPHQCR